MCRNYFKSIFPKLFISKRICVFMKVEIIRSTDEPERLVTRCARGDYRKESVTEDYDYEDIMEVIEAKENWEEDSRDELEAKKKSMIERFFRKRHMGPFEHPTATFAVEGVSRSCMAQLTRHRHATFDVQSMRYVDFSDFDLTRKDIDKHIQSGDMDVIRDIISDYVVVPEEVDDNILPSYAIDIVESFNQYEDMVENGVNKEDARMVLPIGIKINLTFSMNARSLMHLLDMRLKANAQWEIRELAEKALEEAQDWMPTTFEIYEDEHPNKLQA